MKLSLTWLGDYVELPVTDSGDIDVDAVADALASLGLPVEEVIRVGGVAGVVTAKVLRTERHPEAAKVQRVWVDAGDGIERHVWCGASNFAAGDVVPLATLGTNMPDGRTIGSRGILGIDSAGMLCSARELGLGDDHSGILVMAADTPLGVPYGEVVGLATDVVLDVDITRNRPDAYGYVGVARDLAARWKQPLKAPQPILDPSGEPRSVPVEIVAGDRCGRFTTTVMSGVRVGPGPQWMAERLRAAGMRPINNVVDVSNFVMLELNQPNHAYDLSTLGGEAIRVRLAADGEQLVTLDDVERTMGPSELLICDGNDRPIGLAAIMGGANTEIGPETATIAVEVAWFEPLGIAASASRTGLRSDASTRFERGVDPFSIDTAIARIAELLRHTCPDLVVHSGAVDARAESLPSAGRSTPLRVSQANRIIGPVPPLTAEAVTSLLDPIGYHSTETDDSDVLEVVLPSWRPDSTSEIDVIEEIARHYGYNNVPVRVPLSPGHGHLSTSQLRRRLVRQVLVGLGATEVMPSPFLTASDLDRTGLDAVDVLRITNPLVAGEDIMRTSLRPGLLRAIAFNESHRRPGVVLFEVGHVYPTGPNELPNEHEALAVVLAGAEAPQAVAVWRELAAALGVGARLDQGVVPPGLHSTRSATLVAGRDPIGAIGEVAPEVLDAWGITERVAIVELNLSRVLAVEPKPSRWKATSRHPSSDLDLAFVVPDDVPAEKLDKAIRQASAALLVNLELFDVYRGDKVAVGSRSLAYRLRLQAPDRTLSDTDVAAVLAAVDKAASKLGAVMRR